MRQAGVKDQHQQPGGAGPSAEPKAAPATDAIFAAGDAAVRRMAAQPGTFTVRGGDTLSRIAGDALGDPGRWREIFELNRDQLANPDLIFPGQTLRLPGGASDGGGVPAPPVSAPAERSYVVQPGDTLSEIAGRLGLPWQALWEANRATVPNANLIHAGQVLSVPGSAGPTPTPEPAPQRPTPPAPPPPGKDPSPAPPSDAGGMLYTVASGDSLSLIAKRTLGDANRWREIYDLNRDQIADPNRISVGMVLKLPGGATTPQKAPDQPAPVDGGGSGVLDPSTLGPNERVAYGIYREHHAFLAQQAADLGMDEEFAAAVLICESNGSGYGASGDLIIRFEPGIFENYTGSYVDDSHAGQGAEYDALARARQIDEGAAYNSISMGAAQIMGFNAQSIGYQSPQEMFAAFQASETKQLMGLFGFIRGRPQLVRAAQNHDWATFALHYNGPGYRANAYDQKLQWFYDAYHTILERVRR